VDLRARVTGYLEQAHFQEGAEVKQGDLLFTIDARPYQAELDRATAALQRAEAKLRLAATNLDRVSRLQGAGGASPEEVAQARASREEAEADLRLGRAALDIVRLNLAFTRVVAPIAGRIGRRLVDPGNLVKADETPLATLVSVDPLLVDFAVDERTLLRLRRAAREGPPRPALTAHLGLAHEAGFPREAAVQLADNQLDPATGTFRLRAVLANPAGDLLPGLFVRVRLPVGPARPVLLVPAEAVGTDQGQRFVYAVDARNQVVERRVTLGPEVEGMRVIERGLEASERVITAGLARVRPGQAVQPQEAPR
jgi:RND family efflux transporter MFP subunit